MNARAWLTASGVGMPTVMAGASSGSLSRDVHRYKNDGNYLAAGKLLEDAGKPQEAVNAYLEGREHFAAAATLEGMRQLERASELYLKAGDYKKSAQVMISAGKPARAAALFLEKGNTLEAARLFGVAGDHARAGDLYLRAGYPLRAAEAYEKSGQFAKAAEAFEKHFMENVSYGTIYAATGASPDQKSALFAGRNYEKAGDLKAALNRVRINSGGPVGGPPGLGGGPFPTSGNPKGTLLYDAIWLGSREKLANEVGRKALIILTDGSDQGSRQTIRDAAEAAQKADAIVYVILIADRGFYYSQGAGYSGEGEMKKLSRDTGGRMIEVGNKLEKLKEAFDQIAAELRSQYNVGYTPTNSKLDGTFRKVEIRPKDKKYKVQTRLGYYAVKTESGD
jgi:tetratricopeptide (TPR) repeat protein